jgi:Putative metal-binding motif/Calx-beta domain
MLLLICIAVTRGFAQKVPNATPAIRYVTSAEYFFENDPGVGKGIAINFAAADTVHFTFNISTANLSPGFHILQMRVRDTTGIWGLSEKRLFYNGADSTTNTTNIVAAEYFIDADPGPGKGIATSIGTTGAVVNFTALIPTNLSPGFHLLAIRAMDANGKWGFLETRNFYLTPPPEANLPQITAAEYFYDSDPGVGSATALTVVAGDIITPTFMIPVPAAMSSGNHWLAIRVRDQAGHWSLFEKDTVTVGGTAGSISCPHDTTVTAAAGQCTATVNNIDPLVTPLGSSFTYTLSGATSGNGNGTASGHVFNSGVTTVTYALNNSPSTSCSFKVTVNANVVPSVSISASSTAICPGQSVTFMATPVNGGTPIYQWKLNGSNVGSNSATYQNSSLSNNDVVTVAMTSSIGCASPVTVTSNSVTMSVGNQVTPSVTIAASAADVCSGTPVTFTATAAGGGATPSYQWKLNGSNVGTNSSTYQSSALQDGNSVSVVMMSSLGCANPTTATSNTIVVGVTAPSTPSVSISASATSICPGAPVTFTALEINGGNPSYQWKLNGSNVGTNSSTYQSSTLGNGDSVQVIMTSSVTCVTKSTASSNTIKITVGQNATASVNVTASETTICSGTDVTFTATPTNGGNAPSYQWKLNGNNVGTNSAVYLNPTLQNGDSVRVVMTSSLGCVSQPTVSSNKISMAVGQTVTPSVMITASSTNICPGSLVTFTAAPTNGGNPNYQWRINGNSVGNDSPTYQSSSLQNGDSVVVYMSSSLACATQQLVLSNTIFISVSQSVVPSVSIAASATSICTGQQVTFIATPGNGGNNPVYEWTLNGNAVGTSSSAYQNSSLNNGDVVRVAMQSSLGCASQAPVYSNSITMSVGSSVTPTVSITTPSTSICSGNQVTFTATPTNGGPTPTYQWKLNGNNVGSNSASYQNSSPGDGDIVRVEMSSSLGCASPQIATSNADTVHVTASIPPSVTISATGTSVCAGTSVTFTATPTNGGNAHFEWILNGNEVGTNSNTYQNASLQNGDSVAVYLTSSLACANPKGAKSNTIAITVAALSTYYADVDRDGYGNPASTVQACDAPIGYVSNNGDCDDSNAAIRPGAAEVCGNGIDDNCNGLMDENCDTSITLPALLLRTYPVKEGNGGLTTLNVDVTLDKPASLPVSVHWATSNEDAVAGIDYVAASGTLNIPGGSTSGTIQLKVIGDMLREGNERFDVNFSNAVNVVLPSDPQSRVMIIDDDHGKINNTSLTIPTVARRNQVWTIPEIGLYQNEVVLMDTQGQVVSQVVNYQNNRQIPNVAVGLYFYRIRVVDGQGQVRYYSGRLMIAE